MGNQLANESTGANKPVQTFGRRYALGLSKAELDKRCRPSGLYPSCQWDPKAIRRLIGDGRLAARIQGTDSRKSPSDCECPICFFYYQQVNVTTCCKAYICTECFLQVRPPKDKQCVCPFCNHQKLFVTVAKRIDPEQLQRRQEDEQRMIEAAIKQRNVQEEARADSGDDAGGFGSSLEREQQARSQSVSEEAKSTDGDEIGFDKLVRELSMTKEDRQALEEEMKAQHMHPLALQMEAEAEERRLNNEREFHRSRSGRIHQGNLLRPSGSGRRNRMPRLGSRSRPNWNEIVDAFERGGNGEINSLDDLVVLEAALILSMEEDARRSEGTGQSSSFDAQQHAREGFPLVQEFLNSRSNFEDNDEGRQEQVAAFAAAATSGPALRLLASGMTRGGSDGLGGTTMRELTDDEQMAMAIALSMQEAKVERLKKDDDDDGEENGGEDEGEDAGGKGNDTEKDEADRSDGAADDEAGTSGNEDESPSSESLAVVGSKADEEAEDSKPAAIPRTPDPESKDRPTADQCDTEDRIQSDEGDEDRKPAAVASTVQKSNNEDSGNEASFVEKNGNKDEEDDEEERKMPAVES